MGGLGAIAPVGKCWPSPSEGENLFFQGFLLFIVPFYPLFSPLVGRVRPPSEKSWCYRALFLSAVVYPSRNLFLLQLCVYLITCHKRVY